MSIDPFDIIIVGGGTAGWLTAAFLKRQLPQTLGRNVNITLIEAEDIPTVGVGEATIPSIRQTLEACGIEEHIFLKHCDATFKHGIEFINWRQQPEAGVGDSYFHPFGDQIKVKGQDPTWQWLRSPKSVRPAYAEAFSVQGEIAKSGLAPKSFRDAPYDGALSYAYHLDAGKLAGFLKEHCKARGVAHLIQKVVNVIRDEDTINTIELENGEKRQADLFIDCTGFAARLINSDKKNPFHSKSDTLFVDRAVTTRLPQNQLSDINGYTQCTAQSAGWIWDIRLQKRRGVGHVYSSRHISDEDAKAELADHVGVSSDELDTRLLNMRIGYQSQQWRGNCVAIGLSSGFLEPLESTGIYLIEMANWAMLEFLPRYAGGSHPYKYDAVMHNHYDNIVDFLKLHYCLSKRRDTEFWRQNCDPATIPITLLDYLSQWKTAVPNVYDFNSTTQCFSATNYKFVLYGMGWADDPMNSHETDSTSQHMLFELAQRREKLKHLVTQDTVPNIAYFQALQAL